MRERENVRPRRGLRRRRQRRTAVLSRSCVLSRLAFFTFAVQSAGVVTNEESRARLARPPRPMHAVSENKHRLVVTHDSARFSRVFAGCGMAAFGLAIWRWHQFAGVSEPFWGAVGASSVCLLVAAVFFERSRFVIDASLGMIEWHRHRLLGARHGAVNFSDVHDVVSERPLGRDASMRRVVLHTSRGELPVTVAYLPDPRDVALGLALKIRQMVGLAAPGTEVPEAVGATRTFQVTSSRCQASPRRLGNLKSGIGHRESCTRIRARGSM